ncbi:conserved hypothetical protein [Uncinocarpus reesii 1704]|uniref:Uncharacterized protein n=1 Tax=Uncinocarpus reesii (strain UAMH 1704) TaxID=336963 RepID=C4JZV1_UNCRE|nr:uncharacterized protein UREG_07702 [Uncinocarpus reesii 1704]EEP82837.1 conserved hypothetical protein [Uncinocarpus reesii 1704]
MERACAVLLFVLRPVVAALRAKGGSIATRYAIERRRSRHRRHGRLRAVLRMVVSLQNVLIGLWIMTLWWGERKVFRDAVEECAWSEWEKWPKDAVPHHTLLIADPQLVDAHTYPGRPWPLSSLTVYMTDLYLFRTHALLQKKLRPDSTFFLGDLFDGGREWATETSSSPDERYKSYGNDVWMKEYGRFSRIYFDTFKLGGTASPASPRGRKIIASLPGNHDLGFGNGIQLPVLQRFRAYFGEGNRVDIVGNHTFASVDSVSLSAMDQAGPAAASSSGSDPHSDAFGSAAGGSGGGHLYSEEVWKPTETFLNDFRTLRSKAIREELLSMNGEPEKYLSPHTVVDATVPTKPTVLPATSDADFPTVVLTHVPLFREAGTPCGPLREHWPPSGTDPPPEKDERNAIRIGSGYQYQNVLTPTISNDIMNKTGPVVQIYSGDDHDYCEITHREFSDAPKEITVKSTSFAMSVRKPGVQLASLWNPIDPQTGRALKLATSPTIQNHLCLLPDQLSVFIYYAYVIIFTLLALSIHAVALTFRTPDVFESALPVLPLTHRFVDHVPSSSTSSTSTSASSLANGENRFGNRCGNSINSRTASPSNDGTRPAKYVHFGGVAGLDEVPRRSRQDDWDGSYTPKEKPWPGIKNAIGKEMTRGGFRWTFFVFRTHFLPPFGWVAGISLAWYFWLLWTW